MLDEILGAGVESILVRVASAGLGPEHLNRPLAELKPVLYSLKDTYGIHVCGEGGEFESFVLNAP